MLRVPFLFFLLIAFHFSSVQAAEIKIPVQARFFAGMTNTDPKNVNETLEAQGLKKFQGITQVGFEVTAPVLNYLNLGARYTKRLADVEESSGSNGYSAKIDQDAIMLLARVPFVKTDIIRLDVFGGVGGTNTTMKVKTGSQDGEFTKRASGDWLASPYTAVGASAAIGYKQFFFYVEGGLETNKVDSFKTSGTTSSTINTLDLSGGYFMIGLMFDGIPGTAGKIGK